MKFSLESPHAPKGKHSYEWSTPPTVFRTLDAEFNFTVDVCATKSNAKCDRYYGVELDGLKQSWANEIAWCNPPYGRNVIDLWVKKAFQDSAAGATVVMLLPNNTDTGWWHMYCIHAEVRFLRGRLNFGGLGSKTRRTRFGSAVVIFMPRKAVGLNGNH